mgnify:CR=1 FL=1
MTIAHSEEVKAKLSHHVWLEDIRVLILFVWIAWLESNTSRKSELCDTIKSLARLFYFSWLWVVLLLFICRYTQLLHWAKNILVALENIGVELLVHFSVSCLASTDLLAGSSPERSSTDLFFNNFGLFLLFLLFKGFEKVVLRAGNRDIVHCSCVTCRVRLLFQFQRYLSVSSFAILFQVHVYTISRAFVGLWFEWFLYWSCW